MGVVQPCTSIFFGQLLDNAIVGGEQFRDWAWAFLVTSMVLFILSFITYLFWMLLAERLSAAYRRQYFRTILNQEMAWFDECNPSQIATKLNQKTTLIHSAVGQKTGLLIVGFMTLLSGQAIGLYYGWQLTLIMLIFGPLLILVVIVMNRCAIKQYVGAYLNYTKAASLAQQALSSIKTVLSFGNVPYETSRFQSILQNSLKPNNRLGCLFSLSIALFLSTMFLYYSLGFLIGAQFVQTPSINAIDRNPYTAGKVLIVFFSAITSFFYLGSLGTNLTAINEARIAAYQIKELKQRQPTIDYTSYKKNLQQIRVRGHFQFKNVRFAYPTQPTYQALRGVSFTFEEGKTTAIVGPSGCGKSTIMALLSRLYDPTEGDIQLDGVPLAHHEITNIRTQMGYVGQNPVLYNKTIKDNVLFGAVNPEKITDKEVEQALRAAQAMQFVEKLKEGINTLVGITGKTLSRSQKQRIAIARVIIRKPRVLLLDEATSQLDIESEKNVLRALEGISRGVTTITVTSRLSTIQNAHKIVVLENGRLIQQGTHRQLLSMTGLYQDLYKKQENLHENGFRKRKPSLTELMMMPHRQASLSKSSPDRDDQIIQRPQEEVKQKGEIVKKYPLCLVMRRVLSIIGNKKKCFILLIFLIPVHGSLFPLFSLLLSKMLISLINSDFSTSDLISGLFMVLVAVSFTTTFLVQYLFQYLGTFITTEIRKKTFSSILRQSIYWHDKPEHSSIALCNTLAQDASKIQGASTRGLSNLLQFLVAIISGVIIALIGEWRIALILIALFPLILWGSFQRSRLRQAHLKDQQERYTKANILVSQSLDSIKTVLAFASQKKILQEFTAHLRQPLKQGLKNSLKASVQFGFSISISYGIFSTAFLISQEFHSRGWIENLEDVFIPVFAIMFAAYGAAQAQSFVQEVADGQRAAVRVFKLTDQASQMDPLNPRGKQLDESFRGEIEFRNVKFKQESGSRMVLDNFNLKIEAGQRVALVGKSGCGKSSVISLIQRFYDVEEGEILLDGIPIKEINLQSLRQHISREGQEPLLFNDTIENNIRYGKLTASKQEIEKAAQDANAMAFIEGDEQVIEQKQQMPNGAGMSAQPSRNKSELGIETTGFKRYVGPKESHLSGGQKLHIAIARAIIRNPKILLLDDVVSVIDKSERAGVQKALDHIIEGRTSIVVASGLEGIENADVIHVMDKGRVSQSGTHEGLMQKKGLYYQLYSKREAKH